MNNGKLRTLCLKLAIPAVAVAMALPAHGTMVTYSTTGGFSASGGASSATFTLNGGSAVVSFIGETGDTVNASPTTFASAGTIQLASTSTTGVPLGGTFTLNIDQTVPSSNNGSLTGNLTGSVTFDSSSGALSFASTTLTLGATTYTLLAPASGYQLVAPTTNGGHTTLEMQLEVTQTGGGGGNNPTPEPSFFALTGLGFAGMGLVLFRRFRKTA
ncbi:MAG TPA: hypothetical protein VK789_09870 [Bryobacteraceae bacterium]|jgi:hypothetical protein|nr:hypothetical protein [Bryobacteraceae bacterium]